MSKVAWIDVETSNIEPKTGAIIQLACLIEIKGEVVAEHEYICRPHDGACVEPEALAIHGRTVDEVWGYDLPARAHSALCKDMGRYVNKYDKLDKFVFAGYNAKFDNDFVRSFFLHCNDNYFGSWFHRPVLDVYAFVAYEIVKSGLILPDYKLTTMCGHYGIEIQAHDAMSDIRATRELFIKLTQKE